MAIASARSPIRRIRASAVESAIPGLFLAAPMIFLAVMVFWPLLKEVWLSFTNTNLLNPNGGSYVGIQNYVTLLTGPDMSSVLLNTFEYMVGTVVLSLGFGIFAAVVVSNPFPGQKVVRAILASPWAVPGVAAALIWSWMFDQHDGILNRVLKTLSVNGVPWLTSPHFAMLSVVLVTAWLFAPFVMLVTLAALQSVPQEVVEASRVDGAKPLSTFRFVVWPHILPTVRLITLLLIIWCLRRWDLITILTAGGPADSTNTLVVALQQEAFEFREIGMGATYGVFGIVIATIFAIGYYVLERRELKKVAR